MGAMFHPRSIRDAATYDCALQLHTATRTLVNLCSSARGYERCGVPNQSTARRKHKVRSTNENHTHTHTHTHTHMCNVVILRAKQHAHKTRAVAVRRNVQHTATPSHSSQPTHSPCSRDALDPASAERVHMADQTYFFRPLRK